VLKERYLPYLALIHELSGRNNINISPQSVKPKSYRLFWLWLSKKLTYKILRQQIPPFFADSRDGLLAFW